MALNGTLKISGYQFPITVQECEYEFTQKIDENGKPSRFPHGGIIKFTIHAPDDSVVLFHEWMFSKAEIKEGTFILPVTVGTDHREKTVTFEYGYCVGLKEHFSNTDKLQMNMTITVSAAVIKFGIDGNVVFTNNELIV